jgi:hypothetical protein
VDHGVLEVAGRAAGEVVVTGSFMEAALSTGPPDIADVFMAMQIVKIEMTKRRASLM